jgi:hypothetical protein
VIQRQALCWFLFLKFSHSQVMNFFLSSMVNTMSYAENAHLIHQLEMFTHTHVGLSSHGGFPMG